MKYERSQNDQNDHNNQNNPNLSQTNNTPNENQQNQKSKIVAALLAFFFGCFGIHHFYLGNSKTGIIYLCISVPFFILCIVLSIVLIVFAGIGCLSFIPLPIWSLIEFIIVLATSDANFDAKYNQKHLA